MPRAATGRAERVRRSPVLLRAIAALLAFVGLLFTGALLLSDRAPGLLRSVLGDAAERLWERVHAAGAPTAIGDEARARPDFLVHVIVWAVVTALAALAAWSLRGVAVVMAAAFGAGLLIELLQGRWTRSRAVEAVDVLGNATGVLVGGVAAAAVISLWSALTRRRLGDRPRGIRAPVE